MPTNYLSYIGEDVVDVFCNFLIKIEDDFSKIFEIDLEVEITPEEQNEFENINTCYYCLRFLDNATKSMVDGDFKITRNYYPKESDFQLLRKKGAVPYSFYDSFYSFNETTLTYEMFFNDLIDEIEPEETSYI
jgi:hypothetical protein